jgi:hypothetical protein
MVHKRELRRHDPTVRVARAWAGRQLQPLVPPHRCMSEYCCDRQWMDCKVGGLIKGDIHGYVTFKNGLPQNARASPRVCALAHGAAVDLHSSAAARPPSYLNGNEEGLRGQRIADDGIVDAVCQSPSANACACAQYPHIPWLINDVLRQCGQYVI